MKTIAILATLVVGALAVTRHASAQVEGRDYYVIKTYSIEHEGLTFEVKGYMKDDKIIWQRSDPGNAASYAAAKERVESQPERRPTAKPGPPPNGDNKPVRQDIGQTLNFGMEPGRMKPKPTYEAGSDEAKRFVTEAKEGSSEGKLHVTVIGTDDARAPVVNDLQNNPAFANLRDTMMIQDYSPDEWPIDPAQGFVTTGTPTILVQTARSQSDPKGGRVVFRASDYSMGPEALAEAIRKANPDYKPSLDPTPSSGKTPLVSCPFGFTRDHWPHILIVGICSFLIQRLPRKGG